MECIDTHQATIEAEAERWKNGKDVGSSEHTPPYFLVFCLVFPRFHRVFCKTPPVSFAPARNILFRKTGGGLDYMGRSVL